VIDLRAGREARRIALSPGISPEAGDHAGVPCWDGLELIQPTRSALLRIAWPTGRIVGRIDHANFADLHSVAAGRDGAFLVVSTGNELVLEIDAAGHVRRRWQRGRPVPPERDDRRAHHRAFKPHVAHPNHAVQLGERLLVTELLTRQCVDLLDPSYRIPFPEGPPHDGRLREGLLWFTTTNGWLLAVDPDSRRRAVAIDLARLVPHEGLLGWCRGVEVSGDIAWVGLSQLRHAAWRELARRVVRGEAGRKPPARVVALDWRRATLLAVIALEDAGAEIYGLTVSEAPSSLQNPGFDDVQGGTS